MREAGIVRRIDDLGRVVIPREIRKKFGIKENDPLEIFVDNDEIVLRKHNVSIRLNEFLRRLDNEFSDIKNDVKNETADKIYEHISALRDILKSMEDN